jgi:hypothetical protein
MLSPNLISLIRRVSLASATLIVSAGFASAQNVAPQDQTIPSGFSSSNDARLPQIAELSAPSGLAALPSAPEPAAAQDRNRNGGGWLGGRSLAIEIGGGATVPPDKNNITWGWDFTLGGGLNFNKQFAMLAEYQFIHDKLPGKMIAQTGAQGGYAHIWSLTLAPVVSLFPHSSNDVYLTGGGGFYRKVTNFTDPSLAQYCNYYYCGIVQVNQVVGHFSSNQAGWNIGGGYQHRLGGMFNDSRMKLFVEARYLMIFTPAYSNQPNGLGTTTVAADTIQVPINVGVRW